MAQTQCENCHGYRVVESVVEKTIYQRKPSVIGIGALFFLVGGSWAGGLLFGVELATGISLVAFALGVPEKISIGRDFECTICGYRWSTRRAG